MQQTFEFNAFAFSHYYKAAIAFFLLVMLIIVIPGMSLANYFLPDNGPINIDSHLTVMALITIPLAIIFFVLIKYLFFRKITIHLGENIIVKRGEKKLLDAKKENIAKTILRNNDGTSPKTKFRTLEIVPKKQTRLKIVSRDSVGENIFNNFIETYIKHCEINVDKAEKKYLSKQGDYKMVVNHSLIKA